MRSVSVRRFFCSASDPLIVSKSQARKLKLPPDIPPLTPPPDASSFPSHNSSDFFHYELIHRSKRSRAKVGRIHTPHGVIDTPGFVPVATNGALKCISMDQANDAGMQLMFCNAYHLLLHPGPDVIAKAGGIHKFVNRPHGPIITDSGGFQVFSLAYGGVHEELHLKSGKSAKSSRNNYDHKVRVTEAGAQFHSYRDGKVINLTPEASVRAQKAYGADIIIPLDELPPYHIEREALVRSVFRSHRWMARSLKVHLENVQKQAMFGVIHGNCDQELRKMSVDYLTSLPFDGFAIGGALGKSKRELNSLLDYIMPLMPFEKPCHLLGIADIPSIDHCVQLGVDTFDSSYPTRLGRHGNLLTTQGLLHVNSARWKEDFEQKFVIEPTLAPVGQQLTGHSPAYLRHLFKTNEPLAGQLVSLYNLRFMLDYMKNVRTRILNDEI